jgi:tRNA-specific adenosine deaminase 1
MNPDVLSRMVVDAYNNLPSKGKPQQKEWTVLAGIVIVWNNDNKNSQVIAVTTGNRCVGKHRQGNNNIIVDCHAEILVRRCLKRFIYDELLQTLTSTTTTTNQRQYLQPSASGKYRLHSAATLHLVVSQTPCGDASIYPLESNANERKIEGRTTKTTMNWTGAKPTVQYLDDHHRQQVECLRTKSSRSDALIDRRTSSMCCSDKIGMWCQIGLEGALLSEFVEPIWLTSVILLAGHMHEKTREHARMSTERALVNRFHSVIKESLSLPSSSS